MGEFEQGHANFPDLYNYCLKSEKQNMGFLSMKTVENFYGFHRQCISDLRV